MSYEQPLQGETLHYTRLAESADGRTLALGRDDGKIEIDMISTEENPPPPWAGMKIDEPESIPLVNEWMVTDPGTDGEQVKRSISIRREYNESVGEFHCGFDAKTSRWYAVKT